MGLDSRSKYVPQAVVTALGGTPGNGEKRRFLRRKIDDFRGLGRPWGWLGAGLKPGSLPGHILPRKSYPFGTPFWAFSGIFQGVFLSVFPGALFFRIGSVLRARGSPKGKFWESILKTF